MRHIILTTQRVSDCMNVTDVGFGKCTAGIVRGVKHISSCIYILTIVVSGIQIFKNKLYSHKRIFSCCVSSWVSDKCFNRVCQRIHTGCCSDKWRKTQGDFRIKNRIARNQRKIVDRIFVTSLCIYNDSGKRCLTSGSGCCWNSDQEWKFLMYFQDSFHLRKWLLRFCNAGTDSFGTVHTGAAAKSDQGITVILFVESQCFLYVGCCWIGNCFVVDCVWNICRC